MVRFSFQRFGDHLVARALLEGVSSPAGLFDPDGKLAFLLAKYGVAHEWSGLFYALVLHFADRYGVELVDELPSGFAACWHKWPVEDAFVDSIRWRSPTAFSDRTLELLNRLSRHKEDITALLIELAVVEDHPWNGEFLHRNLISRTIAERDAFWTVAINAAHDDPGHPLVRLSDWSLNSGVGQASDATLGLALATLAWSCSTSARIRDTASKAVLSILATRPALAAPLFELRTAYAERRVSFDRASFKVIVPPADRRRIVSATATLRALLTPAQRKRYAAEANAWVTGSGGREWIIPGKGKGAEFDAQKCKVWVANRALSFGWTAERFPGDRYLSGRSERGGRIERIGKKYQRIAMMELLARLADNFWMKPQWESAAAVYDNPLDVEFTRDLEPSIMPADQETTARADLPQVPPLVCEPLPVERRGDWVADPDLPSSRLAMATCADLGEPGWLTLYRYAGHDIDAEREDRHLDPPWLQSDFHFLTVILLSPNDRARLVEDAVADAYDFHEWLPSQTTDGPYVGELARRDTWHDEPWTTLNARLIGKSRSYKVIQPTTDFLWESHLDGSLPNGFSRHVPIPWLIRSLRLTADASNLGVFRDPAGVPTIVTGNAGGRDRSSYVLIRRAPFLAIARENGIEPIWTVIGERRATILKKKRQQDIRVRYNGLLWFEGDTEEHMHWSNKD